MRARWVVTSIIAATRIPTYPRSGMPTRIELATDSREVFVDITSRVAEAVAASGVAEGLAHVYCPHTTAGLAVNEHADPDVASDILGALSGLVPHRADWKHVEGNADAHVKATLVGTSVTVPAADGRLLLGTWQGVFFCEFDGPRRRHVLVTVVGA
jgi:secondary thiamine-phosphate synthase enzyme